MVSDVLAGSLDPHKIRWHLAYADGLHYCALYREKRGTDMVPVKRKVKR